MSSTQSRVGSSFLTHGSPNPCTPQGQTSPDLEPLRSPFSLEEDAFLFSLHGQGGQRSTSPSCPSATCYVPHVPSHVQGLGQQDGRKQRDTATLQAGSEAGGLPWTPHPEQGLASLCPQHMSFLACPSGAHSARLT